MPNEVAPATPYSAKEEVWRNEHRSAEDGRIPNCLRSDTHQQLAHPDYVMERNQLVVEEPLAGRGDQIKVLCFGRGLQST
jgi:hypothetical protein